MSKYYPQGYAGISFAKLSFPDKTLSDAFLVKHQQDHMNVALDLWQEAYPLPNGFPRNDAEYRKFFANSPYLKLPEVPSTIYYIFGEYNVYTWAVDNRNLEAFKKDLRRQYDDFVKVSGPSILRMEIKEVIRRGLAAGVDYDDVVKILNNALAEDVTSS